jgi:hypothetical protein
LRKRDEATRRMVRRITRANPGLGDPAAALGLRRLAQLSLLTEKLYERCKSAETDGTDPQQFILAAESFRRACQTASLLERNLRIATAVIEPPPDTVITLARTIRERRSAAGTEVSFAAGERKEPN